MKVAVITGSSASGLACMKSLLQKTISESSPVDLIVRGCFRLRGRAATARSSLPAEALQESYEVHTHIDATDIDSLRRALEGVERAMLVTPSGGRRRQSVANDAANSINMIQASKEVGVKRIVHVGCWTAKDPERLPISSSRVVPSENYLKNEIGDDMEWTVLRGGYSMSNFSQFHADSINTRHELLAVPECKIAPVNAGDIGEAAANLLVLDDYLEFHRSVIDCCGPELYNHKEMAEELGAGIGRTIRYSRSPTLEDWLEKTDHPFLKEPYMYLADQSNPGKLPFDPDVFADVLGRPPTTLRQWAYDNRVLFGGKGY